jgi:transcriptional regulator with XRE-family HTH domain
VSADPAGQLDQSVDPCRRPLEAWELPLLAALGERLRELREWAGLSQRLLGEAAELSADQVSRIERGRRRTRRSTLARLAGALAAHGRDGDQVLAELLELVGSALAAESAFAGRVERRRVARFDRRRRQEAWRAEWAGRLAASEADRVWMVSLDWRRRELGRVLSRLTDRERRPWPSRELRATEAARARELLAAVDRLLVELPQGWQRP